MNDGLGAIRLHRVSLCCVFVSAFLSCGLFSGSVTNRADATDAAAGCSAFKAQFLPESLCPIRELM